LKNKTFKKKQVANDPLLNKGLAFSMSERDRLRIRGLLPPQIMNIQTQLKRLRLTFDNQSTAIDRYMFCVAVLDRNETLFYRFVSENLKELGSKKRKN
jgi:malate dehydrogenase (oxaloacetate-decarboxylating)(NADP+)